MIPATTHRPEIRLPDRRLFVGGEFVEAHSGRRLPVTNPATGEVFCEVHEADAEDVDRAVKAARRAFEADSWGSLEAKNRSANRRSPVR